VADSPILRIGTLGAAAITPAALVKPAQAVARAELVAVAARDRDRAQAFATKQGIPTVHGSYEELLADPDIDAVYNPLPNGLHAEWTTAALEAGKHVLCEKPFTSAPRTSCTSRWRRRPSRRASTCCARSPWP
jgi:predicted dehydrogenase